MGVTETLNAYPTYIIAYLSLIHCLSPDNGTPEGWYLLTNVGSLKLALASFKCRSGIEAMFKDCKTGGYNARK
jgi:hypothetical protein